MANRHWGDDLEAAANQLRQRLGGFAPTAMLTLGTGLSVARLPVAAVAEVPLAELPGMPVPKVAGHPGKVLALAWGSERVLAFQGRVHLYEGRGWPAVTAAVRLAASLGVRRAVFTNASGSLRPTLPPGTLVVLDDHLNLLGGNPLVGGSDDPATLFTDMTDAYAPRLRQLLDEAGRGLGVWLPHGIYAAVSGPSFETPAEVRMLAALGADLVGMSTAGEVIMARHLGLECAGLSCVTNLGAGLKASPVSHEEHLAVADTVGTRLAQVLDRLFARSGTDAGA